MNNQTIIFNRKNVINGTNNTKYVYKFPFPFKADSHEIAIGSLNMYYSWPNIQAKYRNNVFSYMWWNHLGVLNSRQDIIIPDGDYSISSLSDFINSQMLLRGHYVVNSTNQRKEYFFTMLENATYYSCQMNFTAMYAKNTLEGGTTYINENPPTQVINSAGVLVWKGWDFPATKQYPLIIIDANYTMKDYLGYDVGTYPVAGTPISSTFDMIGHKTPEIYPVSAINIQTNLCRTDISIPNNIVFSFTQGNAVYGSLVNVEPKNLIWMRVPDGTYTQIELQFIDQDFNTMVILDNQVHITVLIRDV